MAFSEEPYRNYAGDRRSLWLIVNENESICGNKDRL